MNAATPLTAHQKIGLQATGQSEALLRVLLTAAHSTDEQELANLVQALAPRLLQLNGVSMSAHDPDSDTLASLRAGLHADHEHLVPGSDAVAAMHDAASASASTSTSASASASASLCASCLDNFPLRAQPQDIFDTWALEGQLARRAACTLCPAASKPCLAQNGGAA